jgi:WD40 repeat protein
LAGSEVFSVHPDLSISLGHSDTVNSLAFSRDGKFLASGGSDNQVKIWRVFDGKLVRNFQGDSLDRFQTVVFNDKGNLVAAGSSDGSIRVWSMQTGRQLKKFQAHEGQVRCVAFLPGSDEIVSSSGALRDFTGRQYSQDPSIKFWRLSRHRLKKKINPHTATVSALLFSRNGRYMASGSLDKTVKLWSSSRTKHLRTFQKHTAGILSLGFSPDGRLLATGSYDNSVRIWRTSDGTLLNSGTVHKYSVKKVAFSADGRVLATTGGGSILGFWSVPDLRPLKKIRVPGGQIRALAFSPVTGLFATGGTDHAVRMYRLVDFREIWARKGHQRNIAKAISISPDGKLLASGSLRQIHLWQLPELKKLGVLRGLGAPKQILFSGDSEYMAVITGSRTLKVVCLEDNTTLWEVSAGSIKSVFAAFSPDSEIVALATDKKVAFYWTSTGRAIGKLKGFAGGSTALAFSPDGNYLATSADQAVKLWRMSDGVLVKILKGHRSKISSLAFSPNGTLLASGSYDQTTKIWKVADGSIVKTLKGHKSPVDAVAFSPDGKILVSLGKGDVVQLWRVQDFGQIKAIRDYKYVSSFAFSPEGFMVLGGDEGLRLWAVGENHEDIYLTADLIPLPEGETIAYTPDGYYAASHEGNIFVGWVFGNQLFGFEQFARLFRRPDIVRARLLGNKKSGLPTPVISPPPRVEMVDHMGFKKTSSQSYPLAFKVEDEFKIKDVRVYVNGVPKVEVPVNGSHKEVSLDVPLLPGGNRITVIAFNNKGFSSIPRYVDVECQLAHIAKPNLYVLSVGVSRYPLLPDELQLSFAHTDAYHVAQVFKNQEGKHYHAVKTTLLTNSNVTANRIIEELGKLATVKRNDVVVVYLGGHGLKTAGGKFYFMTPASSLARPARGSLNWELLSQSLTKIRGRVILLLDACHSGSIVSEYLPPNEDLAHTLAMGKRSGIMVFSASKGRQQSLESPDIGGGYGVFTYSIVKALSETPEEADRDRSGYVEFYELVDFVIREVKNLTENYQIPWLARKEIFGDFPLALAQRYP